MVSAEMAAEIEEWEVEEHAKISLTGTHHKKYVYNNVSRHWSSETKPRQ